MSELPNLVDSLKSQTDNDFEWVIADGGSNDGTLEYLKSIDGLNLKIIEGPDFGIYDGLNKALSSMSSEYYAVMGADDYYHPKAIEIFKSTIAKYPEADMLAFPVGYGNVNQFPKGKWPWLFGQFSYVAAHSVGLIIKRQLHEQVGLYSRKYPIAADQYFILSSILHGAVIQCSDEAVGVHGDSGLSGVDHLGVITEFYRVQVAVGFNKTAQTLLCCARLIKNIFK